jgi:hypothetical protein
VHTIILPLATTHGKNQSQQMMIGTVTDIFTSTGCANNRENARKYVKALISRTLQANKSNTSKTAQHLS